MQANVPTAIDADYEAWMDSAIIFDKLREHLARCMDVGNSAEDNGLPLVPLIAGVVVGAIAAMLIFAVGYSKFDPSAHEIVPAQVLPVANVVVQGVAVDTEGDNGEAPKPTIPIAQATPVGGLPDVG